MEIYIVGGAVRDELLNYPIYERDYVVVGSSPEEMEALGYTPVGADFPVFLHPQTKDEYALARTERKSGRGYKGFSFSAAPSITLEEDLVRRDLTINAIAKSADGKIIDPYDGCRDLENRVIRHVSLSFCEDPVRILRVARFAARYHHLGFTVADETMTLMRSMVSSGEVDFLVAERVWKEFSRALEERNPEVFITVLKACDALERIMPEIDQLLSESAPSPGGQLTRAASLQALNFAAGKKATVPTRFSCLMHDSTLDKKERRDFFERIKAPNEFSELASLVIAEHYDIENAASLSASALYELLIRCDALRRPERFDEAIRCCELYRQSQGELSIETDRLHKALEKIAGIDTQALIAQGFSGKALGDQLRLSRIKALETQLNM